MTEKFTKFDAAEYLKTDEAIAAFIADADTTGDKAHIEQASKSQNVLERSIKRKMKDHNMSEGFGPLKPAEHVFISKSKAPKQKDLITVSLSRTISDPSKQISAKPATGKEIDAKAAQIKANFLAQRAQEKSRGR